MKIMSMALIMCLLTEIVFGRATGILLCVILYVIFKFIIKKDEYNSTGEASEIEGDFNFWSGVLRPIKIFKLIPKKITNQDGGIAACVGAYLSFRIMASVITFFVFFLLDKSGYDIGLIANIMYEIMTLMLIIFSIIIFTYAIREKSKIDEEN